MLAMKIEETKNKKIQDLEAYQQKVKFYEDKYYQEVALLMDYEEENINATEDKTKKKRKKKNKTKKKNLKNTSEKCEEKVTEIDS